MNLKRISFVAATLCASVVLADTKAPDAADPKSAPVAAAKVDLTNPKSAALAFGNALVAGDAAGLKATAIGSEGDFKTVDALGQMVSAMKKMSDAAIEKWGKDNELSKGAGAQSTDVAAELEKSEVKVDGDTATIVKKDQPEDKNPMKLVKKDGAWKVDLASLPKEGMDQLVKMAPAMSKVAAEVATEIKAGKYKDAKEAQQAMPQKMLAEMMKAGPAAGGEVVPPAPAPAPQK